MKKSLVYIFAIIFFLSCIIIFNYNDKIISYLINFDFSNKKIFYLYIFISTFYFISPLPITIIIILNGFFFKELGFYISILQIIIGLI